MNIMEKEQYGEYVKQVTPTHSTPLNVLKAFLTGGVICTLGQGLNQYFMNGMGMEEKEAGIWMLIALIGISVLMTGFNLFPSVVKFGGAGALVPITGFANSVASPAIEYKKEGQVFGVGCKIFTIAGPVILFGTLTSWVLGIVVWLLQLSGIL